MNGGESYNIKKVKKQVHAAHGGAWKVAYADFVTAMMAFFLLLWILATASQVTKQGLADYFSMAPISSINGAAGNILGGDVITDTNEVGEGTPIDIRRPPQSGFDSGDSQTARPDSEISITLNQTLGQTAADNEAKAGTLPEASLCNFTGFEQSLLQLMESDPRLSGLTGSIRSQCTADGLRLHLVDQKNLPLFYPNSAELTADGQSLLKTMGELAQSREEPIEITGHVRSNSHADLGENAQKRRWLISTERALEAQIAMTDNGLDAEKIYRVAGQADRYPLLSNEPDAVENNRVTITFVRRTTLENDRSLQGALPIGN